jgi:hypothetical protein
MPATKNSLWPESFGEVALLTPVAILREQGVALGEQTKNIVVGRVHTAGEEQQFYQNFELYCAPLGYRVHLLQVRHTIDLYPATIFVTGEAPDASLSASTPDEFKEKLKEVFARPKTKKIITSLLAQSKD